METSGNALNKRFDRVVKDLAEEAPRLLLELVGLVPPGTAVTIRPLPLETAPPIVLPDYVAELVLPSGEKYVGHIEFLAWYRKSYASTMARLRKFPNLVSSSSARRELLTRFERYGCGSWIPPR